MLLTIAFTGCQESNPSMTIVSFQLDSDEDSIWIYLYSIPRVKMGNLTITIGEDNETLSSVFRKPTSFKLLFIIKSPN